MTAFVDNFSVAGAAVKEWLNEHQISGILEEIKDYLIVPSKSGSSYTVYGIQQYWPFPFCEEEKKRPKIIEKIEFLKNTYSDGFEPYRESQGLDFYGAKSKSRSGCITQRAHEKHWEFVLSENGNKQFTALVTDFRVAGTAVRAWLNGRLVSNILEDISEYLTVPVGLKSSHTTYEPKDE